jgi:hypothetical protein
MMFKHRTIYANFMLWFHFSESMAQCELQRKDRVSRLRMCRLNSFIISARSIGKVHDLMSKKVWGFRMYWVFEKDMTNCKYLHFKSQVKSQCEIILVISSVQHKAEKTLISGHTEVDHTMVFRY